MKDHENIFDLRAHIMFSTHLVECFHLREHVLAQLFNAWLDR